MSAVRDVDVAVLRDAVAHLLIEANYNIPADVLEGLRSALSHEESPLARRTLEQIIRNYEIAARDRVPVCQDSGVPIIVLESGQDVHWIGGEVHEAIHAGVREGTRSGYLRQSVTGDPTRLLKMAGDERPASIYHEIRPGDRVTLTVASKGFGSENMSALRMLKPSDGIAGIHDVVVEVVDRAGANACPPIIIGVGIGGTFASAAYSAMKGALRPITMRHPRSDIRDMEQDLLARVNALGIGAQGLGGVVTALAVNIEVMPTHIAGLPVAVNLSCHSTRRASIAL